MKEIITILILLIFKLSIGQTESHKEKFRYLEPDIWLGILDKDSSDKSINIDTINYDEIPKYLEFRGTVVEALKWTDSLGENILIQTVTGHFTWKDYDEDSTEFMIQDKSELYAYLFRRQNSKNQFKRIWKVYDFNDCFGVDWFTGFIPKGTTITDIDKNGITEITMPYVLICRGGMDPGTMKIIMYEDITKYTLRGSTMVTCIKENITEGRFEPSKNLLTNNVFFEFLTKRWDIHKCEKGRFY